MVNSRVYRTVKTFTNRTFPKLFGSAISQLVLTPTFATVLCLHSAARNCCGGLESTDGLVLRPLGGLIGSTLTPDDPWDWQQRHCARWSVDSLMRLAVF